MNKKVLDLVQALTKQTEGGKVRWKLVDEDMYRADVGRGMVRIGRETTYVGDFNDQPTQGYQFHLWVMNDLGHIAEEAVVIEGNAGSTALSSLFTAARNSALDSGRLVDDMLSTLSRDTA